MKVFIFILLLTHFYNKKTNEDFNNKSACYDLISTSNRIVDKDFIETDPYEMMESVFVGNPSINEIKPLVEGVLKKYSLPKTDEYRLRVGSMLLSLRKNNEGKLTEMQILRHIYYYGSNKMSLPDQAGFSVVFLLEGLIRI